MIRLVLTLWARGVLRRVRPALLAALVAIDQLAQVLVIAPWWCLTGSGRAPDPNETISGLLGRHAAWGWVWAKVGALLVDALFFILTLGLETEHCARVWRGEEPRRSEAPGD